MFGPKGPFCQSCGMPLSKDPKPNGGEYCSYCYQDGKFVNPEMTLPEMQELVKGKLKEMHLPGFLANKLANDVAKLKRWVKTTS